MRIIDFNMKYKLFFIYEGYKNADLKVRIEVGINNISKSIPPFIRNITLVDLVNNVTRDQNDVILLLNNLGQNKPPFYISGVLLAIVSVQNLLQEQISFSFLETQKLGSLKKNKDITRFLPKPSNHPHTKGKIIGGDLYITNISNWKNNIQTRILYEGAISIFFPIYNKQPFQTHSEKILYRDKKAESSLLSHLKEVLPETEISFSLSNYDIEFLKTLKLNNWSIYLQKSPISKFPIYLKQNKYGINWFSTDKSDIPNENISELLLQAYLESRHYREIEGEIILFDKEDIVEKEKETLTELICEHDNLKRLYIETGDNLHESNSSLKTKLKKKFVGILRDYQLEGVAWLRGLRERSIGCLLADEMGLGKTIQILAHLAIIQNQEYPHLIIAPTSLLPNWKHEIEKFVPDFKNDLAIQPQKPISGKKIILVSYDILRLNIDIFKKVSFDTIVLDEAQIVKNRKTKKYKSIGLLNSKHRIILTGTPIENSVDEIWSHFLFLNPELKFLLTKLQSNGLKSNSIEFVKLSSKLLKPFILRRVKADVINDLPDKIEKNIYITLCEEEKIIYKNVQAVFIRAINTGITGQINSIALEGLLRLRQACVNPNMLPPSLNSSKRILSSKLNTALIYINQFCKENKKVLVFSQFVEVLNELERHLELDSIKSVRLDGSTKNRDLPVHLFQNEKDITVFLISLRAGGVGLNLTAAERVILLDAWWNPAVEDQAFARAHRIGQKNNVIIFRLICRNTVEEKIMELHEKKKEVSDIFQENKNTLSINELKELISM